MVSKARVDEPNLAYDSLRDTWRKCRAFSNSQQYVKDSDNLPSITNYLLPFSPTMSPEQFNFFKAEAEVPGITPQFIRIVVGSLLRKPPVITYKKEISEEIKDWVINEFTIDGGSLIAFLYDALMEEMETSRAWVFIDYPNIASQHVNVMSKADWDQVMPYAVIWKAESIINCQTSIVNGKRILSRVVIRGNVEKIVS